MSSGNTDLDTAFRLLQMRQEERAEIDDEDDYLEELYGVSFEALFAFYEQMIEGETHSEELSISLFTVGFELGMLHERFVKDMELIS